MASIGGGGALYTHSHAATTKPSMQSSTFKGCSGKSGFMALPTNADMLFSSTAIPWCQPGPPKSLCCHEHCLSGVTAAC